MTNETNDPQRPRDQMEESEDEKSDLKVVIQFFIVPLVLVAVLVLAFFGLQFLRSRSPDPRATLRSLEHYEGFLGRIVGDLKRWQYGYDLSLLMRGEDRETIRELLPSLIEGFGEAGSHGDLKLRRYLALALGTARDPRAIEALRGGLADDDPMTRLFCVWGLAEIEDRAALPDLRALVDDADSGVRKMSIFALGRMGEKEDAPRVREALDDPEVDVRWNAALALAQLGDEAAVPVLVELLDASIAGGDPQIPADAGEREVLALNAIRGLALLRTTESKAALRRAAASGDESPIAEAARLALDGSGPTGAGFP